MDWKRHASCLQGWGSVVEPAFEENRDNTLEDLWGPSPVPSRQEEGAKTIGAENHHVDVDVSYWSATIAIPRPAS